MPAFYGYVDLQKNELRNAVVQNLGSAPGSPLKGQMYMDTTANILYWYNGTAWVAAQSGSSLNPATTVTTQAVGDAAVVGTLSSYAREDHKHGREAFAAPTAETTYGTGSAAGSAATLPHSDHTHGNPTHLTADHSAVVLTGLAIPTANLNMNGHYINNVLDPIASSDGATKNYVDASVAGLSWKTAARVASTANIATLSGLLTVDGVTVAANDRVLVKNQSTASANGIYVAASGAWSRSNDALTGAQMLQATMYIEEGTTQADTAWVCTTNAPITIGTTPLTFVQFSGGGTYTAGTGLTLTGNVFAADTTYLATQSFVTSGYQPLDADLTALAANATNGFWSHTGAGAGAARTLAVGALPLSITNPDGVSGNPTISIAQFGAAAAGYVPQSGGGTTTFLRADGTWVAPVAGGTVNKYATALTGTASPETVTHNLNSQDVIVMVHNSATPYSFVQVDWTCPTVNTVVISYNPNLGAGYRAVVMA